MEGLVLGDFAVIGVGVGGRIEDDGDRGGDHERVGRIGEVGNFGFRGDGVAVLDRVLDAYSIKGDAGELSLIGFDGEGSLVAGVFFDVEGGEGVINGLGRASIAGSVVAEEFVPIGPGASLDDVGRSGVEHKVADLAAAADEGGVVVAGSNGIGRGVFGRVSFVDGDVSVGGGGHLLLDGEVARDGRGDGGPEVAVACDFGGIFVGVQVKRVEDVFAEGGIFDLVGRTCVVEDVLGRVVDPLDVGWIFGIERTSFAADGDVAILVDFEEGEVDVFAIEGDVDDFVAVFADDEESGVATIAIADDFVVFDDGGKSGGGVAGGDDAIGGAIAVDGDLEDGTSGFDGGSPIEGDLDVEFVYAVDGAEEFGFAVDFDRAEQHGSVFFAGHGVFGFVGGVLVEDEGVLFGGVIDHIGHGAIGVDVDFVPIGDRFVGIDVEDAVGHDFHVGWEGLGIGVPAGGLVLIDDEGGESAWILADEGLADPVRELLGFLGGFFGSDFLRGFF